MKRQWNWMLGIVAAGAFTSTAWAQHNPYPNQAGPSLLPIPQVNSSYTYPTTHTPHAYSGAYATSANYRSHYAAYGQPMQSPAAENVMPPAPEALPQSPPAAPPSHGQNHVSPSPYQQMLPSHAINDPYQAAASGTGWGEDCTACLPTTCGPQWFGGVYGLYMSRDDSNLLCMAYDSANWDDQVVTSRDAEWDWQGGVEARLGRTFGCSNLWAIEGVYWGIYDDGGVFHQATTADVQGNLNASQAYNELNIGIENASNWTDAAQVFQLRRHYDVNNVEINLLRFGVLGDPYGGISAGGPYGLGNAWGGPRFSMSGSVGVRYFHLDEGFSFLAENGNGIVGDNPLDELIYQVETENHLVGVQLGARADYWATQRFSAFADIKFGLYGNYIDQQQLVALGDGTVATINGGPWAGQRYDIHADKCDVSFLGEVRLGGAYQINQRWRAVGAYRAVAVTGVALSTEQVPIQFEDLAGAAFLDSNGSLILHGVQLGVEAAF